MLKVGLTGGIGSGKTTVAGIFETLGIPVYYADIAAKRLMNTDAAIRKAVIGIFGEASYQENVLNRYHISSIAFTNPKLLQQLNSIVHPITIEDAHKWMAMQDGPYAIKEAALIFESGSEKNLDFVIGVFAPEDVRIKRIVARDNISELSVKERIRNQMNDEEKMKKCDFVIVNDEKQMIIPQVMQIHEKLLKRIKN